MAIYKGSTRCRNYTCRDISTSIFDAFPLARSVELHLCAIIENDGVVIVGNIFVVCCNNNISICKKNGEWWSIPSLDVFVAIPILSVWFEDECVEFEVEEFGEEKFNCITVYESEEE